MTEDSNKTSDDIVDDGVPESEREGYRRERRSYLIGGALSLALTGVAFAAVGAGLVAGTAALVVLSALAAVQVMTQFRYFLHIDLRASHRDDLQLILFTALIIALMFAGSLWILFDQHMRMG